MRTYLPLAAMFALGLATVIAYNLIMPHTERWNGQDAYAAPFDLASSGVRDTRLPEGTRTAAILRVLMLINGQIRDLQSIAHEPGKSGRDALEALNKIRDTLEGR